MTCVIHLAFFPQLYAQSNTGLQQPGQNQSTATTSGIKRKESPSDSDSPKIVKRSKDNARIQTSLFSACFILFGNCGI
jgi:hypothetical protein